MDQKLYPPRCKARVKAQHKSFFESSKSLDFQLVFDKKCINGKIIIPCCRRGMLFKLITMLVNVKITLTDLYKPYSSESDSSLQWNKSMTSGQFIFNY